MRDCTWPRPPRGGRSPAPARPSEDPGTASAPLDHRRELGAAGDKPLPAPDCDGGPLRRRLHARRAMATPTAATTARIRMTRTPPRLPNGRPSPPGFGTVQYVPFTAPHVAISTAGMSAPMPVPSVPAPL